MRKVVFIRKGLQLKVAEILNRKTEGLPYKTKLIVLIVFFLAGSSICVYTILESVLAGKIHSFTVTSLNKPAYIIPEKEDFGDRAFISEKEYQKLKDINNYMNSLKEDKKGKRLYDSILLKNPSLLDNITMIEKLYQTQTNKKKLWNRMQDQ